MLNCCYIFFFIFCTLTQQVCAQSSEYRHQVIGTRDGLQSSKIFTLYQHQNRQLFIGTELGVSIYNGYDFTNIQYSNNKEQVGRILAITSDSSGGTWMGGDNGLFYFSKNGIKKITIAGRSSIAIECLTTDAAGTVWIGEVAGLYQVDKKLILALYNTNTAILHTKVFKGFTKRVFGLQTDRYLNVYACSYEGVFLFRKGASGAETIWQNPTPLNYVRSVTAHSPDSVYWNCYDRQPMQKLNGKLGSINHKEFIGRTVFIHHNTPYSLTSSGVALINEQVFKPLVNFESLTNLAHAAIIDAEGNIWVGSWEGLIKFRKSGFRQYQLQHPRNTDAFSLLETKNGELLIGGNRGRIFTKKNEIIAPHTEFPLMFERAEMHAMYEHSDGSLWFGSGYQGITRYKNKTLRNWNGKTDELQNNNCEAIIDAGNGKLFACTEKGVTIINPAIENAIVGYYPFKTKYAFYPELFGGIHSGNNAWFFYGSQGLYQLKNGFLQEDFILGLGFQSVYINKIVKDKNAHYWIATLGHGLLKCQVKDGRMVLMKQFARRKGTYSNDVLSVLVDKNNRVWLADYMSLSVLVNDEKTEQLISYNEEDGLLSSYYQTLKLEQQKNGTIWGLTTMGVIAFHPDSLYQNNLAPSLSINHLTINNNDTAGRFTLAGNDLQNGTSFSYKQNSLQFNFTGVSLTDPSKIRYAFRLKELDSNWTIGKERFVNYNFLRAGRYVFELKASNNNNVWTAQPLQFSFIIKPPFWQTGWFILLCSIAVGLFIYLLFKNRVNRVKEKAAIRQQLAELEGKALRAQMNPHFIFNSLNAIQECIVMEKISAAYEYLARFSKLLRMVLHNSEKNLVSLQEEMEMIKLYLELESLRFKNSFEYNIQIDDTIDCEMAEVPPLLLQPFIENAIWHGLRNKAGTKKLSISCTGDSNGISCTILDNGIGREKAKEIKAGKIGASHFESRGMLLSKQRMHMMNLEQHEKFNVHILDLYDELGKACGTKVILYLPQILN
jgi:ligand-binding sensor domain-containing protein